MCFIEWAPPYRVRQDQGPRLAKSKPGRGTRLSVRVLKRAS
jgi:hypothetical protein